MITKDTVERVREAADIVQIIGEYVPLKRVGRDFRGPCPFHQGTHPNFSVSPSKGLYHCYVCHESGDVFQFVRKRLGLDWPAAVKLVGDKSGVEVQETEARREGPDPREPLWEINATAAEYFRRVLWDDESAESARAYLTHRAFDRDIAERFGLGFAPREIGAMRHYLNALGFDDARLLDAGVLVRRDDASEPRPRFRNRLMFPILDAAAHHVGFGGRVLGDGEPKYLNSAESPVFSKGRLLYNLYAAKNHIRRDERVLIVEGYFDVIRLVAAGVESVVAPLGTALTPDQARLLTRYTNNTFLLYDSDKAGLRATFRSGDELLRAGAAVRVVTLPNGHDPDSFVAAHGAAGLESQLDAALDVFDRKVQLLERSGWFADLHRKRRAIDRLLPTIRAAADPLTRDLYVSHASSASGIAKDILLREVSERVLPVGERTAVRGAESSPLAASRSGRRSTMQDRRIGDRRGRVTARGDAAERELVRVMLHRRGTVEVVDKQVGPAGFRHPDYRAIFEALLQAGHEVGLEEVTAQLDEAAVEIVQQLLSEPGAIVDPERTIAGSLARLRVRELSTRRAEINAALSLASDDQKGELLREKAAIRDEIRSLGGVGFDWFDSRP